ncbi:hypothetical protein HPT27_16350 [Permianibacter sp. IMCC34836]|uniref:hypothetical protein n=1 Tax=Permianibacter fluminis TaxID=2738515 RepID=UPI001551BE68|nr:hypothetical protein [Permianibacter fluminis]NQD38596.1 hypothetical protein [Permianibacter fluminis]
MSSRKMQWLPLLLMLVGIALLATSAWFAWRKPAPQVTVAPPPEPLTTAAFYRPASSDWWLYFGAQSALSQPALKTLPTLDPDTPALPAGYPAAQAVAAAGALRIWQFPAGQVLPLPAPLAERKGRWHIEQLDDASLLFWLPEAVNTTAVDRVAEPLAGSGLIRRAWLQQRLNWPAASCEALPLLLQQLPDDAQLHLRQDNDGLSWQIVWPSLPAALSALLQSAGAPQASHADDDSWFWREADLANLPRPEACPASVAGGGFVARLWQQQSELQAALARPGASKLQGSPLPLPAGIQLKPVSLSNGAGLASGALASAWLSQQSLLPENGLLLAVQHQHSDDFAGMQLRLQTLPPAGLVLQWRWPLP